jgi:hypothetical protein
VGGYKPVSYVTKVVLPAPFGPNKPNNSPLFILRHIFLLAIFGALPFTPGYIFLIFLTIKGYL